MKTLNKTPMWTLAIVFAIFTASAFADKMYLTSKVNVRQGPSAESAKVGSVDEGGTVEATATVVDGFRLIKFNGADAYIKDSYLTSTAPPAAPEYKTGCVASLLPDSAANRSSTERKEIIASMMKFFGVKSMSEIVNKRWKDRNNATTFNLMDQGEVVVSIADLPAADWQKLLKKAKEGGGLFGGFIGMDNVQDAVRKGQFTGKVCLEKIDGKYVVTAKLDGTINGEAYNGNRLTLRPDGKGNMVVRGTFAGENINGTFSGR